MMASTLADNSSRTLPASGRKREQEIRLFASTRRYDCKRLHIGLANDGQLVLDLAGEMQAEYRRHLNPAGQPGVGDRFLQIVLHSAPHLVERVDLPKREDGEYAALPQSLIDAGFDPSDRKFAALARQEGIPIYNSTDSDWIEVATILAAEGIDVRHLCGQDTAEWFAS